MQETKLQIRARLLSGITELLKPQNKNPLSAAKVVDEHKDIKDKNAVLEILVKEFIKDNSDERLDALFLLMHGLLEKNAVEDALLKELSNPSLSDSIKSNIINILRGYGNNLHYEDYLNYLENPQEVIDADTTKLLSNAIVNPEAQIDFLDFIYALPDTEAGMLLNSLENDYDGDNLANILSPIVLSKPLSQIASHAIRALGSSKSQLALNTLSYILDNVDDSKVQAQVKKSINLLKLSGIKEDKTDEFYKKVFSDLPPHKCFVTLPDGHGNVGIIFSRKKPYDLFEMFAAVVNDTDGVADCFGFYEITQEEFDRITGKFFANDTVVEVSPEFVKYLLNQAEKTSRLMYDEIPYEYAAWRNIIRDIEYREYDLSQNANKIGLNEFLLKQVYKEGYFDKWFLDFSDKGLQEYLGSIKKDADKLFNEPLPAEKIITQTFIKTLNQRLLLMSYLLRINGAGINADIVYSLIEPSLIKETFLQDRIKKSIYEYFLSKKELFYSSLKATTIFARKNSEHKKIDINFVEEVIRKIEENWAANG